MSTKFERSYDEQKYNDEVLARTKRETDELNLLKSFFSTFRKEPYVNPCESSGVKGSFLWFKQGGEHKSIHFGPLEFLGSPGGFGDSNIFGRRGVCLKCGAIFAASPHSTWGNSWGNMLEGYMNPEVEEYHKEGIKA